MARSYTRSRRRYSIRRGIRLPGFGFHNILMILLLVSIVLLSLLLSGCTTSTQFGHNVYVLALSYRHNTGSSPKHGAWNNVTEVLSNAAETAKMQVRLNYFGYCASKGGPWICQGSAQALAMSTNFDDPLGLLLMAERYRGEVLFPGLVFGSIVLSAMAFLILSTFPSWKTEVDSETGSEVDIKPFPRRKVQSAGFLVTILSVLFCLLAALWQHTSAATAATVIEVSTSESVQASTGAIGAVLAWLGVLFAFLAALGGVVAQISRVRLDYLLEDR